MIVQKAIDLVKSFESLARVAYIDPVGIPTIGYGHTAHVVPGMTCTLEQADAWLAEDLGEHEMIVRALTAGLGLNENQIGALTSFDFNTGKLAKSTLLARLRARDFSGVPEAFRMWTKGRVNGTLVPLKGLIRRREAEAALFQEPLAS